jgi:soluble lytic murein transglycosylase-like protein
MSQLLKIAILFLCLFCAASAQDYNEVVSFCNIISDYYKQPREILPAIIRVESQFVQNTISDKNAYGIMQVTGAAYDDYMRLCKDPFVTDFARVKNNYKDNIRVGAWYLFVYLMQIEKLDYKDAITAYFWGRANLNKKATDRYYNDVQEGIK